MQVTGPKTLGEIVDAGVEDRPPRPPPGRRDENVAEFDDRHGREQDEPTPALVSEEPTPRTSGQTCSPWFSRHGISATAKCAKKTAAVVAARTTRRIRRGWYGSGACAGVA